MWCERALSLIEGVEDLVDDVDVLGLAPGRPAPTVSIALLPEGLREELDSLLEEFVPLAGRAPQLTAAARDRMREGEFVTGQVLYGRLLAVGSMLQSAAALLTGIAGRGLSLEVFQVRSEMLDMWSVMERAWSLWVDTSG